MANPQKEPLDESDILRFLKAKNAAKPCPSCGGSSYDKHDEKTNNSRIVAVATKFPGSDIIGADAIDLVMLGCSNCAFVQFFARTPIVDWLGKSPS